MEAMKGTHLDLAEIRARLAGAGGKTLWQSLEELAQSEEFEEYLHREFPRQASELDAVSRRGFLKLMAASLALAGLGTGCTSQPEEAIYPYVQPPEELIPGVPLYYATAFLLGGYVRAGLLVENHMGRPTKVEGNPRHPINGHPKAESAAATPVAYGSTDVFAQASVLGLYDPDRSQVVTHLGRISTYDAFLAALLPELERLRATRGAGLRLLTEAVTSPTLARQIGALLEAYPQAKWVVHEPVGRDTLRDGTRTAFGEAGAGLEPLYRFDRAQVVVALDADFLTEEPASLLYARDLVAGRRVRTGQARMSRLHVAESHTTLTGAMADHRLPLRSREVEALARALARALSARGVALEGLEAGAAAPAGAPSAEQQLWVNRVAADLAEHRGASLLVAGLVQPPAVHALVHAMNGALGNAGKSVVYLQGVSAAAAASGPEALRELVDEMNGGRVETLVVVSSNPVYTAPADLTFASALDKVPLRIRLGLYDDETSRLSHWHVPEAHYLEAWSDARAADGTATILQPLIAPLYGGHSAHELLSALIGQPGTSGHDAVRETWRAHWQGQDFERTWRRALHDGLVEGTASAAQEPPAVAPQALAAGSAAAATGEGAGLEIVFRPDPHVWDGRFANNGWLQELPRPLTKLVWDNAAILSPATAEQLGVKSGDLVVLELRGRRVEAPVWTQPGQADGSVTVHLGYGRTRGGRIASAHATGSGGARYWPDGFDAPAQPVGFDAYAIRASEAPWIDSGLQIRKTGRTYSLVTTEHHHILDQGSRRLDSQHGRDIVRVLTLSKFAAQPASGPNVPDTPAEPGPAGGHGVGGAGGGPAAEAGHGPASPSHPEEPPSLIPEYQYPGHAWGMVIDLNACIGCNACAMACQAENNVPIVGKAQVAVGREMHWLRVDRYYSGEVDNPETYFQPMLCQQCEKAPCEVVCPVAATVHSDEGLNDMVYNRCIGTRYCSNNCPYKVRRFNFMMYSDYETPSLKLLRNPDVTVRTRGVMEKCTYCVQRINAGRIEAKKGDRRVEDGDILTACQQACPTEAIVFGDINDRQSSVARLKAEPQNYGVLAEIGTQPRTSYLPRVLNPRNESGTGEGQR